MNKRLVWNFEIGKATSLTLPNLDTGLEEHRWESRFFWSESEIITLQGLDETFLELSRYKLKQRQDTYYLLPGADYNLKIRRQRLFYKPVLLRKAQIIAYDKKIKLEEVPPSQTLPGCAEKDVEALIARIKKEGRQINVDKEAFIYQFDLVPTTRFELARLRVEGQTYFSMSIESRSLPLVESIKEQLLGNLSPCDYVTFLRRITICT